MFFEMSNFYRGKNITYRKKGQRDKIESCTTLQTIQMHRVSISFAFGERGGPKLALQAALEAGVLFGDVTDVWSLNANHHQRMEHHQL